MIFQIHLWTGLVLALYVVVIGITGSILVFGLELSRIVNPSPWADLKGSPQSADIEQVIDSLKSSYPHVHVISLMAPNAIDPVFIANLQFNGRTVVALHPTTGQLLGPVENRHSWLDWVYELHENLLAGRSGRVANAICAGALLLLALTGLVNWWSGVRTWTRGLRVDFRRTWRRINFDLHSALGFWSFIFLLIWSISGIYFAWPAACLSLLNRFLPVVNARAPIVKVEPESEISKLDFHSMLSQAYALDPGAQWKGIIFPSNRRSPFQMLMARSSGSGRDDEDTLFFNPYNGRYISTYRYGRNGTLGDWIIWLQMPLHFGTHWGLAVKCLWATAGLALPLLAVTGFLMYWNRVLSKRRLPSKIPHLELLTQYRRTLVFLRPYRKHFLLLFFLGLISTVVTLAQPYLTKLLIDNALLRRNMRGLWYLAAWMAICSILSFVLGLVTTRWYTKLSANVLFDMRVEVFRRLQLLSPRFYAETKTGDIVSRLNGDISELQRLSSDTLLSLPSNLLFLVGSAAMMAYLDVKLFLFGAIFIPFSFWAMRHFQPQLRTQARSLREQSADIGNFLIESVMSMRLIVCSNAQDRKNNEFQSRNQQFIDSLMKLQVTSFLAGALPGATLTLATASLFLWGGAMVIRGTLTIGSLMAFMAYYSRLLSPVQSFMATYSALVTGSVSLQRVFELLDKKVEVQDPNEPVWLDSRTGRVELQAVTFAYHIRTIVSGVSFVMEPRTISVLVGATGAGKSTIIDLLLRFYDPAAGEILLDGMDVRSLSLKQLRTEIAVVDQSPFLFHASIRDNLLFAAPEANDLELETALKLAGIWEFVDALPDRFNSTVGERGLSLSVGQRQRLAIARALLRTPSVLILDEPSSSLDPTAEFMLGETLLSLKSRCTVLIVTHRSALLEIADRAFVLEDGRIVEQGSPAELLLADSALGRHFRDV